MILFPGFIEIVVIFGVLYVLLAAWVYYRPGDPETMAPAERPPCDDCGDDATCSVPGLVDGPEVYCEEHCPYCSEQNEW